MLVLSRKVGQKIVIDEKVTVTITRISGGRVSIGIEAPSGVQVRRSELAPLIQLDLEDEVIEERRPNVFVLPARHLPTAAAEALTSY